MSIVSVEQEKVRDKLSIRSILDAHMLRPNEQRVPWLVGVSSREHMPAGWTYEGCHVISAHMEYDETGEESEKTYSFTIDGNLMPPLKLSKIEYVWPLR